MKGHLRDIHVDNPIGLLPNIINTNNQVITAEFDNIFDASNNVLTKSLDASGGFARAHWGYFVNLDVNRLNVKDVSASFGNILKNVDHNSLGKRYFDEFLPEERLADDYYAHDINMIKGLPKALAIMNASIATLWKSLSIKKPNGGQYNDALTGTVLDASVKYSGPDWETDPENPEYIYPVDDLSTAQEISETLYSAPGGAQTQSAYVFRKTIDNEYVNVFHSDVIKYTYPKNYYGLSWKSLEGRVSVNSDLYDIKNGKYYNYVQVVTDIVKIDNSAPFSLSMSNVGAVITVILEKSKKADEADNDFVIKLSTKPYEHVYIKAADARMTKIKLICVGITDDYGPQFDIYEYSGNIEVK